MNEEDLRRLLTVAAEDVRPTRPAIFGWDRARRVRRARWAAGATALAVALIGGGTTALLHRAGPPPATPAHPTVSPATNGPPVQRPPATLDRTDDPLGRLGNRVGAPLSARPVDRALALLQPINPETGEAGVIRILGDDGMVRKLDVVTLAPTRDASGNEAVPLKPGSLSPDGRTAAFAQTGEVVVVDLTDAAVRRYPLAGYLEHVVWAGDRLLVGDNDTTYELDRRTGTARKLPVDPWGLVVPEPARPGDLLSLGSAEDLLAVRRFPATGGTPERRPVTSGELPPGYRLNDVYGRGWQRGNLIAQAGWTTTGSMNGAEGLALLDARTGAVTRLLDLGREDRAKACCEVLGWSADGAVLFRYDLGGLARWQPETGEVAWVARDVGGLVALPAG
ncbi:hypothetical protein [Micromonospora mirobrigensis]|uniref:WD40-like Beta Propeller Repeat n=1 Tax=Micromonospora mirobrigensis TaxID=262898 RepID=A0A1C4VUX6_9ACTN|nr:hypothetical protein [Micromonospora mirobrigensis]SCE87625.1 hypothetical protein GA0070564_1011465 [Micromonospora mirobrigensis]